MPKIKANISQLTNPAAHNGRRSIKHYIGVYLMIHTLNLTVWPLRSSNAENFPAAPLREGKAFTRSFFTSWLTLLYVYEWKGPRDFLSSAEVFVILRGPAQERARLKRNAATISRKKL